jgi:hypothetical protein
MNMWAAATAHRRVFTFFAEQTKFKIKSAIPAFMVMVMTVLVAPAALCSTGFSSASTSSTLY